MEEAIGERGVPIVLEGIPVFGEEIEGTALVTEPPFAVSGFEFELEFVKGI